MIKLVIIDFDDTICMTEEACFHLENETAKRLGFPPMSREMHLKTWGKPLEEAITERIYGINVQSFMQMHEIVHEEFVLHGKVDQITKENLYALKKLLTANKRLAILTSRLLQETKHLLDNAHPLTNHIEKFYHKDNTKYSKPDPRVFDEILKDFNINNYEAVYIGDTISDADCAKRAGLHFIAILESGLRKESDFQAISVDYFATTFVEACEYVITNN